AAIWPIGRAPTHGQPRPCTMPRRQTMSRPLARFQLLRRTITSISPFSTSRSVTPALGYSALNDSAASTACARSPYQAFGLPSVATSKRARGLIIPESMRGPLVLAPPTSREGRQGGFECHSETEYRGSVATVVVDQSPHPWPAGGRRDRSEVDAADDLAVAEHS